MADSFAADWAAWQQGRLARLRGPQGWLALVGLHWLEAGPNRLAGLPGVFTLEDGAVTLSQGPGAAPSRGVPAGLAWEIDGAPAGTRRLASDAAGAPDRIRCAAKVAQVIDRGGALAVRVWDADSPARSSLRALPTFPLDPRWRLEARWEAYPAPRELLVPAAFGVATRELVPGRAHFNAGGRDCSLEPVLEDGQLFFVFKDRTAPAETYGGGRFLMAAPAAGGTVVLDFNRAVNPPCVFTPFATCPLPLAQNRLPIRVEAGERNWSPD